MTVEKSPAPEAAKSAPSLSSLMQRVQSGVVRIESDTCNTTEIGTGVQLSSHVVATVEHVVDGASAIRIKQGKRLLATARIIGADPDQDLALLLTDEPLPGQAHRLASRPPALGEAVAAVGFPLGLPLSVTQGTVSGTDRTVPIDNYTRHNLIQTDAAVNPGNSGGPLLSIKSGRVVGLLDLGAEQAHGLGFAVSSKTALKEFARWKNKPQPVSAVGCPSAPAALPATAHLPPAFFFFIPIDPGTTSSGNTGNTGGGAPGNTGGGGTSNTPSGNTGTGNTGPGNTGNTSNTGTGPTTTTGNTGPGSPAGNT